MGTRETCTSLASGPVPGGQDGTGGEAWAVSRRLEALRCWFRHRGDWHKARPLHTRGSAVASEGLCVCKGCSLLLTQGCK